MNKILHAALAPSECELLHLDTGRDCGKNPIRSPAYLTSRLKVWTQILHP